MTAPAPIHDDPRFLKGVDAFNRGEFFDAGEEFEDLYFEAVRDEIEFIRVFLQMSVGIHHIERNQFRGAAERLRAGIAAIGRVADSRGFDFDRLAREIEDLVQKVEATKSRAGLQFPKVHRNR